VSVIPTPIPSQILGMEAVVPLGVCFELNEMTVYSDQLAPSLPTTPSRKWRADAVGLTNRQ
jgi:hypothetical protein